MAKAVLNVNIEDKDYGFSEPIQKTTKEWVQKKIKLSDIIFNQRNYYTIKEEELEDLALSIDKTGLSHTPRVRKSDPSWGEPEGKYVLLGGERRIRALIKNNTEEVTVNLYNKDLTRAEEIVLISTDNSGYTDRSFLIGTALSVKTYLKEGGSNDSWDTSFGLSSGSKQAVRDLMSLDDKILMLGVKGVITTTLMLKLAREIRNHPIIGSKLLSLIDELSSEDLTEEELANKISKEILKKSSDKKDKESVDPVKRVSKLSRAIRKEFTSADNFIVPEKEKDREKLRKELEVLETFVETYKKML